jgi:hypothetical protein
MKNEKEAVDKQNQSPFLHFIKGDLFPDTLHSDFSPH